MGCTLTPDPLTRRTDSRIPALVLLLALLLGRAHPLGAQPADGAPRGQRRPLAGRSLGRGRLHQGLLGRGLGRGAPEGRSERAAPQRPRGRLVADSLPPLLHAIPTLATHARAHTHTCRHMCADTCTQCAHMQLTCVCTLACTVCGLTRLRVCTCILMCTCTHPGECARTHGCA